MTYNDICAALRAAGIEEYSREAALLVTHYCREITEAELPFMRDFDLDSDELRAATEKRCKRYPLQYILGEWEFFGLPFDVNDNTLIPRSDTELVVETAVKLLPPNAEFADLCTGSGCIAVSVSATRRDCKATAVEICRETLSAARHNAIRNGVEERTEFIEADILNGETLRGRRFDAVVSNPPYIRTEDINRLMPEVKYEPSIALDGGDDGLKFYRAIARRKDLLKDNGFIVFEIGYDQADGIRKIAADNGYSCEIMRDMGGNDRVAVLFLAGGARHGRE